MLNLKPPYFVFLLSNIIILPNKTRPLSITVLVVPVLWLAFWNGLRLGEVIFYWKTLLEYGTYPLYIAISGGAWLFIGLLLFWCIWQGKSWGRMAVLCGTIGYTSWYWLDRLILQSPHANWPFALTTNTILLFIIFIILYSQKTKRYFKRDVHEQQPETPTTA